MLGYGPTGRERIQDIHYGLLSLELLQRSISLFFSDFKLLLSD